MENRPDRAEAVALFRYGVIAPAVSPHLSPAERGAIVRELAAGVHTDPDGVERVLSRSTIDRWLRAYRDRGLKGLKPTARTDTGALRRHPELFEEAARMRRELPTRSAEAIAAQLTAIHRIPVSARTIRAQLASRGLTRAALAAEPAAFGRYEAERVNQRWIGDYLVGPWVPHPRVARSRRARLMLYVDDRSRLLVHGVWGLHRDHPLRPAHLQGGDPAPGAARGAVPGPGRSVRRRPAAALRRRAGGPDHPLPALPPPGPGQAGTAESFHS